MPGSKTIKMLEALIEELTKEIDSLDVSKDRLVAEKERAELALSVIKPKHFRPIRYNKDSTAKQKAIYCLRSKRKVLSTNEMLEILYDVDPLLKEGGKTLKSLRLALFRLSIDDEIVAYKTDMMKSIRYGLKSWTDENGQIKDEYL